MGSCRRTTVGTAPDIYPAGVKFPILHPAGPPAKNKGPSFSGRGPFARRRQFSLPVTYYHSAGMVNDRLKGWKGGRRAVSPGRPREAGPKKEWSRAHILQAMKPYN